MKFKKVRQLFFGFLTVINSILIVLLCLAAAVIIYARQSAASGETLQFFGYSVYVTSADTSAAVVIQQKDPRELSYGAEIICRELSTDGTFYPISCTFLRASDETPLTATVLRHGDTEPIDINRDDILGQRVASSVLLGNAITALKNPENQKHALLLFGGGGVILCLLLGFIFWVLHRRHHKKECPAPIERKQVDLSGLIEEQEDVKLSVQPIITDKKAEEAIPLMLDGWDEPELSSKTAKTAEDKEKATIQ